MNCNTVSGNGISCIDAYDCWFTEKWRFAGFTRLPRELQEMLVIKSTVAMFVSMISLRDDARTEVLKRIMSVSFATWKLITSRKWNRNQLRQTFECNYISMNFLSAQLVDVAMGQIR